MNGVADEEGANADEAMPVEPSGTPPAVPEPSPAEIFAASVDKQKALPVSSLADKVKGFVAIAVFLFATGYTLNYAFSDASPLISRPEDKVNKAMLKYSAPLSTVQDAQ